jgi:hypothetical protein
MSRKKNSEAVLETTLVQVNVDKITIATEREAKTLTAALREDFKKFTASWWEMGQRTKEALDRGVPAAMEMNAHDWMKSVFGDTVSVAKVQRSLRIARALGDVPQEQLKLLSEGKAYLLTQLKEKDRAEFIGPATILSNDAFAKIVEERRQEYGIPPEEKRIHIGVSVPESVGKAWEEAEKKVARLADLDIETKPGLRAQVFEIVANLINSTPDEVLTAETVGSEGV